MEEHVWNSRSLVYTQEADGGVPYCDGGSLGRGEYWDDSYLEDNGRIAVIAEEGGCTKYEKNEKTCYRTYCFDGTRKTNLETYLLVVYPVEAIFAIDAYLYLR